MVIGHKRHSAYSQKSSFRMISYLKSTPLSVSAISKIGNISYLEDTHSGSINVSTIKRSMEIPLTLQHLPDDSTL